MFKRTSTEKRRISNREYQRKRRILKGDEVRAYERKRYAENPNKKAASRDKYRSKHPEIRSKEWETLSIKRPWANVSRRYNISEEDAEKMYLNQNGRCTNEGCKKVLWRPGSKVNRGLIVAMDHDHITGKNRAFLCVGCNTSLGHLSEDIEKIKGLARYCETNNKSYERTVLDSCC